MLQGFSSNAEIHRHFALKQFVLTVSKAFDKSSKIQQVYKLLSIFLTKES